MIKKEVDSLSHCIFYSIKPANNLYICIITIITTIIIIIIIIFITISIFYNMFTSFRALIFIHLF